MKMRRSTAGRAMLFCGIATALSAHMGVAYAQESHRSETIDIPAGPAAVTLMQLAQKTRTSILFSPEAVSGVKSRRVSARLTPQEAARRMLEGSELYVLQDANGALLVRKRPATARLPSPAKPEKEARQAVMVASLGAPALASPPPEQSGIADIVVTATRREESLQKIPVTVTAISGDTLRSSGILDTRQLTQVTPGLVGARQAGVNQPVIRGVGTGGVVGDESNVATYIDGVYQPDPWTTNLDLVEIQRIEVLRGPQGTLFGRNATGGLINIITPDPSFDMRGHVSAAVGTFHGAGDYDLRAYVTGGLSDRIAVDFAGLYKKNDNYVRDIVLGDRRYGGDEYYSFRSKLLFKASDTAEFVLTGDYAKRDGSSNIYEVHDGNTVGRAYPGVVLADEPWETSLNYAPLLGIERYAITLQSRFDLGATKLETASSYQHGEIRQRSDRDSTNIDLGRGEVFTRQHTFTQEVRLLSQGSGPLQWLAGVYYYWSELDGTIPTTTAGRVPPPTLPPLTTSTSSPDIKVESLAGFAEGTYALTDTLFVTLGGRYTTESRHFRQSIDGVPLFPEQQVRYNKFTYRGAVRWQFDPHANVYVNYGTGFKSGVFNGVGTSPNPVRPENLKSIEGGVKADLTRWLRTNLSIFHYNYRDLQVSARDAATNLVLLSNAANAEIYGGELEVTVMPTRDLTLGGSLSYLHGEYKSFLGAEGFVPKADKTGNTSVIVDASGNQSVLAPRYSFNLRANWDHDYDFGKLGATVNLYHSDRVYYDFTNNFSQKPYSLVNAELRFAPSDRLNLSVGVTNLTNAVVFQSLRVGTRGTDGIREKPREVKASVRYNF